VQSIRLEIQDNQLKIQRLVNKPNEKTDGRGPNKENHSDRRDKTIHRPRDDDNEFVHRIKVDPPPFDGVHDPKDFSNWLADIDYYFDWYSSRGT